VSTGIGPDGYPAVFEGGGWVSHDRRYRWNGVGWTPVKTPSVTGPWLMRVGTWVLFIALGGVAVYTIVSNQAEYSAGYFVGVVAFFGLMFVIFRGLGGRWGCFGAGIRVGVVVLALLRVLNLIAHLQPH
jgi:hypothetical protein